MNLKPIVLGMLIILSLFGNQANAQKSSESRQAPKVTTTVSVNV